ncbi:unnamed protein product, partial [Rotaria sp. Silwood2]
LAFNNFLRNKSQTSIITASHKTLQRIVNSKKRYGKTILKKGNNSYEEWRANIHRELEEDLQRQVRELLEETERQERLAKLQRQYLR